MTVGGIVTFFTLFVAALAVAAVLMFGLRAVKLI
ncbi:MAG: cytochrome b6-f complex subunit PetL [Microcoleaceae cyanobacterium MO_207.B10]|nr:cytochrome b6-f complex subunit PetL [Microcoleaceae cyanobacterium MO_207.B10]